MSVKCQLCGNSEHMSLVLSLGYMPPPNDMPMVRDYDPKPQEWYPTEMWFCSQCELAQLGYKPDQTVAFPEDYPYTSGATLALKKNFVELRTNVDQMLNLKPNDLLIDIGSNDGTLLDTFDIAVRKLGIEPTAAASLAIAKGIPTEKEFFNSSVASNVIEKYGQARLITCTNCFAHMEYLHDVVGGIKKLLTDDGMFVSESHYLIDLLDKLQYDTIYAEHLRYYSLRSIAKLLNYHGLQVIRVDRIPTHGGSIRVYANKKSAHGVKLDEVSPEGLKARLAKFSEQVQFNKLAVLKRLEFIKALGGRIVGIGAPSRASTVISYLRLDKSIVEYVCEQPHSHKIDRLMPGTDIPVVPESLLYDDQPEAAILFSWHLADELIPKIRAKGYHGEIILPCSAEVIEDFEETVEHHRVPIGGGVAIR